MMASHKTLIVFASLAFLQSCSGFVGSMLPLSVNRICQKNVVQMSAVDRRGALKTGFSFAVATALGSCPVWADDAADWMEVEDPSSGKTYWYNTKTQKTSFEKPGAPAAAEPVSSASSSEAQGERPKISRMGGLLEPYKDINKGFSLYRPAGWNQFDSAPGEYDIKWEDIVEKSELVMVGSSPVKTATSVSALGPIDKVGATLAAKKKAELLDAKERTTDGILYYTFFFRAGEGKAAFREVYELSVSKGKLWSVTATTAEKRWGKREQLFSNIVASFQPRL